MAHDKAKRCCPPRPGCPECEVPQRARNHYFTGKLLVERDFTDEQRFFLGKDRRHNQRLHGWGTVCGLRVVQHPNEACRDRWVVIEPGTAIDCCGREVLVQCEELFDFRAALLEKWREAETAAGRPPGDDDAPQGEHRFQVCIRYRECPDENIPALFDECACDADGCQPNRILEGFALDLLLDPDLPADGPAGQQIAWCCTLNLAHATAVAPDAAGGRVYALSGAVSATLWAVSAATQRLLASRSFALDEGLDVAVSADGTRVYVALQEAAAASDPEIQVLDAADLGGAVINTLTLAGARGGPIQLAALPDGRLAVLDGQNEQLLVYGADINSAGAPAPPDEATGISAAVALAVGADGAYAYVAHGAAAEVSAIRLADLTDVTSIALAAGTLPSSIAAATNALGDVLAVADAAASSLALVAFRPAEVPPVVPLGDPVTGLTHPPVAVALSPSGNWAYVLEEDPADQQGYLQAIDAHRVELGRAGAVGDAFAVGEAPRDLAVAASGARLYVAWEGDGTPDSGGVALLDAFTEDCRRLFEHALDPCPDCSHGGECLVLATVEGYQYGDRVVDLPPDGQAPGQAPGAGEAAIDNLKGRVILPSTRLLTEVVECLLEQGCTGGGQAGPAGPAGPVGPAGPAGDDGAAGDPGPGIDDVEVDFVDCGEAGSASIEDRGPGERTLVLEIPSCCSGELTHICGISWRHNAANPLPDLDLVRFGGPVAQAGLGLVVAFDGDVRAEDIHALSFRVLVADRSTTPAGTTAWLELRGRVTAARLQLTPQPGGGCRIDRVLDLPAGAGAMANGAIFFTGLATTGVAFRAINRVELLGDAITAANGLALDANHLPPWLPDRPTGDCIAGGRFESWFFVDLAGINLSPVDRLAAVPGFNSVIARAIVAHREEQGPFTSLDDLLAVPGIGRRTLERARPFLAVEPPSPSGDHPTPMGEQ